MREPVDHIERPVLPWRSNEQALTECGISAVKVKTLTRSEFQRRFKEWGERRTAITTCMTCVQTARRWTDWTTDPRQALEREIYWEGGGRWSLDKRGTLLRDELKAIATLIINHRDEFVELLHRIAGTVDLLAVRRKKTGRI